MKVYFIGIGGIGISALAQYYLSKGNDVFGSDLASSEVTDSLKEKGASVVVGPQKAENLPEDVDLVSHSLFCMSSAIDILCGVSRSISSLIHCISDQPSPMSSPELLLVRI